MFKFTGEEQFNESVDNVLSTIRRQVEWPIEIAYQWRMNERPFYIMRYSMIIGPLDNNERYVRHIINRIVDSAQIAECDRIMDECDLDSLSIKIYPKFERNGDDMYGRFSLSFYGAM